MGYALFGPIIRIMTRRHLLEELKKLKAHLEGG